MHKRIIKKFKRRYIYSPGIDVIWTTDLILIPKYAKQNNGYKYILTILDTFFKYAWIALTKKKDKRTIANAFENILKKGRYPQKLWSDGGGEYDNHHFRSMLEKYNIKPYRTESKLKAIMAERFNQSLMNKIAKMFTQRGNHRYIDDIERIVNEYNNSYHSSIKMTPFEASKKENEGIAYYNLYNKRRRQMMKQNIKPKFKVGDIVRIYKFKKLFEKGYDPKWSNELFVIYKNNGTIPNTYKAKSIEKKNDRYEYIRGNFYEQELQKKNGLKIFLYLYIIMTNKKIEKIIQTFKSILIDTNNVNKHNIIFFARRSIENYNKKKYNKYEQKILDSLLDYYAKPTRKKENIVNLSILDYYQSLNNKQEPVQQHVQEEAQEPVQQHVQEQEPDNFTGIRKNKSAMKRTLNLYDIPLKEMDDKNLYPMEDDQLNYSRELKREFLLKKLREIGQFKCNTIMGSELTNVRNPEKKINPFFQTKYHVIRNESDIEEFLIESEKDIINRVGKFMKKADQKNINFNNSKPIKKKKVFSNQKTRMIMHLIIKYQIKRKRNQCFNPETRMILLIIKYQRKRNLCFNPKTKKIMMMAAHGVNYN